MIATHPIELSTVEHPRASCGLRSDEAGADEPQPRLIRRPHRASLTTRLTTLSAKRVNPVQV